MNLLAQSSRVLGYGVKSIASIDLNWIGQIIKWLIEGIGIIGVGIIVFTLILKTIVLPLDIYSRIKTKKQALVMDKMRPQMEKLQKQYANDKNMYSQKVMELQKKNGYSMLGACLPMLVSLIIFIFVFNAFSTYSQYANLESYNDMVNAYNGVVTTYILDETDPASDGFLIPVTVTDKNGNEETDYRVEFTAFANHYNNEKGTSLTEDGVYTALMAEYKEAYPETNVTAGIENSQDSVGEAVRLTLVSFYIEGPAAQAAADYYAEHNNSFLWVGNLWYPDSMLNKEVPDFSKFKSTVTQASIDSSYEDSYNKVTANLVEEKNTYNGYFVLIVLSIGFMLLQQWISMRANKSVNDLSTVDGSGARTNKMMMIMMPIIYGVFAFLYSASFSLYMITNTVYSIITTLIINKVMDVWFAKKEERAEHEKLSGKRN
ncbi:MAG: membrane protein insertase YidC [Candidatus Coproplasma sp.]